MPVRTKAWRIQDNELSPINSNSFQSAYKEQRLEKWLLKNPSMLGDDLLVIGNQLAADGLRPDMLCIDNSGQLVVVELKRTESYREAIAQVLEYGAWLNSLEEADVVEIASQYLEGDVYEALREMVDEENFIIDPSNHRMVIVAPGNDERAERTVDYLASYGLPIEIVAFDFIKVDDGIELLTRRVYESHTRKTPPGKGKKSTADIVSLSTDANAVTLLGALKPIEERLGKPETWDDSFRFSWTTPSGKDRVVLRIYLDSPRLKTPKGSIDISIRTVSLSEASGIAESEIKEKLAPFKPFRSNARRTLIRFTDQALLDKFVQLFLDWAKDSSPA
jgi:hypothetical protein